ncbi:MAG: hypothetical protein ABGY95_10490 [Rubritalea sp.]|uniref:hypothetical protein n=1 Tax=Rubritalea sp. TaxID=2109375 RepID=UPI003242BB3C
MIFRQLSLQSLFTIFLLSITVSSHTLDAETSPQKKLIEDLFTSQTSEEFNNAVALAIQAKVPQQTLLEARFIHHVDNANYQDLAELSRELLALKDSFDSQLSQIFTLEEDWKAIVKYTLALDNLEQGNAKAFESNIKEAFWLSPRQASAFAPHIEQHKLELAMRSVTIDFKLTQSNLLVTRAEKIIDPTKDINILFFWSPWSREFTETIADFSALCDVAKESNILIRTIIAEQANEVNQDAIRFIKESKLEDSALWLKEDSTLKLSTTLRIQSVPTVLLIDKHGKIQFNGHPAAPRFWTTLKKYVPASKRPNTTL